MKNKITLPVVSINRHRLKTDGVGVTTLVASYGCPLKCKYCINKRVLDPAILSKCVQMTPEQLYEKVKIDDLYFIATGGGITLAEVNPFYMRISLQHSVRYAEINGRLRWKPH